LQFANLLKLKKKMTLVQEITKQKNFEVLKAQHMQEREYTSKFTLCIDLENVLLAKIDLYDEDDVQEFINCTDLDRNFIVLKKHNVKYPLECRGGECN
jgi:hypothetical protein